MQHPWLYSWRRTLRRPLPRARLLPLAPSNSLQQPLHLLPLLLWLLPPSPPLSQLTLPRRRVVPPLANAVRVVVRKQPKLLSSPGSHGRANELVLQPPAAEWLSGACAGAHLSYVDQRVADQTTPWMAKQQQCDEANRARDELRG